MYGGGTSRFQPVYVGDLARAVEIISRLDTTIEKQVSGKITEAGGPDSKHFSMSHTHADISVNGTWE